MKVNTTSLLDGLKKVKKLDLLFFLVCLYFSVNLIHYFYTGLGGPIILAVRMVPVALIIFILNELRGGKLYPKLGDLANKMIATGYILICVVVRIYMEHEFWNLVFYRAGAPTTLDLIMGGLIIGLFMEISRKLHFVLFVTNVVVIVYILLGPYIPIDALWHPGIPIERVISSSSIEFGPGVMGDIPQIGLTLIGAFLLIAAVASGFGAEGSLIRFFQRIFGRSSGTIPQVAVVSGAAVGMVSGSGAANVSVNGPFTIPLMKSYGLSPVYSGAIVASAALGGLIMPPVMGIGAFIMAEFLGVSYWEVVKRGFAVAAIYYGGLALSTYLLTTRNMPKMQVQQIQIPKLANYDKFYTICFFGGILLLIYFMGFTGFGVMLAAVYTSVIMLVACLAVFIFYNYVRKVKLGNLWQSFRTIIETYARMTSDLVILLGILGILIGLLMVSGFMLRMGVLLMRVAEVSIILLIIVGFIFGWLVGLGVPPAATYIVVAVVFVMPFTEWGIQPWVTHFFAFLLGVWSEFSPPTSVTSAVASRISGGSFMKIMMESLKMCSPVILLTFAIFVRTEIVVLTTGLDQLRDTILLMVGCLGIVFLMFGKFSKRLVTDIPLKMPLCVLSLVPLFHPNITFSWIASALVVGLLVWGVYRHGKLTAVKQVGTAV